MFFIANMLFGLSAKQRVVLGWVCERGLFWLLGLLHFKEVDCETADSLGDTSGVEDVFPFLCLFPPVGVSDSSGCSKVDEFTGLAQGGDVGWPGGIDHGSTQSGSLTGRCSFAWLGTDVWRATIQTCWLLLTWPLVISIFMWVRCIVLSWIYWKEWQVKEGLYL